VKTPFRRQEEGIGVGHYVPHTDEEIAEMLDFIGLSSLDELFDSVPAALRLAAGQLDLAPGLSEADTLDALARWPTRTARPDAAWCASPAAVRTTTPSRRP